MISVSTNCCSLNFIASIKSPKSLTKLDVDLVVKLTEPQGELGGAAHPGRRLGQVGPHVLGTLRAGVQSAAESETIFPVSRVLIYIDLIKTSGLSTSQQINLNMTLEKRGIYLHVNIHELVCLIYFLP